MNANVRKVFDMLGVEPNEEFKIEGADKIYRINEDLSISYKGEEYWIYASGYMNIASLLRGNFIIIKLPKEPKKKKLRDLTEEEYNKWKNRKCHINCKNCIFNSVYCDISGSACWIHHKDLYSDKFLDQEIEVE